MAAPETPGLRMAPNWNGPPTVTAELFAGLAPVRPPASGGRGLALDMPQILDRCLGSRQLVERVLQSYSQRFSEDMELIRTEIEAGCAVRTAQAAHRLKGASANAAAPELAELSAELEAAARDEQLDQAQRIYRAMIAAWPRFVAAREEFRQSLNETTNSPGT